MYDYSPLKKSTRGSRSKEEAKKHSRSRNMSYRAPFKRAVNITYPITISRIEAIRGGECKIVVSRDDRCPNCQATGFSNATSDGKCAACAGLGYFRRKRNIIVKIPRGTSNGQKIVLKSMGNCAVGSDEIGDLILDISIS